MNWKATRFIGLAILAVLMAVWFLTVDGNQRTKELLAALLFLVAAGFVFLAIAALYESRHRPRSVERRRS